MKHTVLAALNRQQQPNHYQNFLTVAGKTINSFFAVVSKSLYIFKRSGELSERESGQSKETPLVIYLAFLAKEANLYYVILTAFWSDTVARFMSGTQETFI